MDGYREPVDDAAVAHNFRVFAEAECGGEPLYAALARAIANDGGLIALTMHAPLAQRRPVLLFAAVHDLLLAEAAPRHPLARFYGSVVDDGPLHVDVDGAMPFFVDFCRVHHAAIVALLTGRATQTNEVGRCAGLRLALATLPVDRPLALIDVGCSAGLNLLVDRFRYTYRWPDGTVDESGPDDAIPVRSTVTAGRPPRLNGRLPPAIVERFGIDRAPLDVRDPRDARWLRACVWPSETERHARLAAAIALARETPPALIAGDATARLADVVATVDPAHRPVLFHSWVVSYFDRDARRRFADAVRTIVAARDGAWISAETAGVVPGLPAPPLAGDSSAARREATVWHVTTRDGDGVQSRCIARSQPHGGWIEWLGPDDD